MIIQHHQMLRIDTSYDQVIFMPIGITQPCVKYYHIINALSVFTTLQKFSGNDWVKTISVHPPTTKVEMTSHLYNRVIHYW